MCYAIPGLVEDVRDRVAVISYFGERKEAFCELVKVAKGDYVYAQGGYIIEKVPPSEAKRVLSSWKDIFFELKNLDAASAALKDADRTSDHVLQGILERAQQGISPSREEGVILLSLQNKSDRAFVYRTANHMRQKYHNNSCCVHGILEISNICARQCAFCGISSTNHLVRYRMSFDEIMEAAREAVNKFGFKSLVLQSGEECGYSLDELVDIIKGIRERFPALIFISFGEVGIDGLRRLYEAGARGILLRFETSNSSLYEKTHPHCQLQTRLEHLKAAYEIGYLIITGGLVGLPGQTKEDLVDDIALTASLHTEMFSFGPFLPHPLTPLAKAPAPLEEDVLGVLALARLMCPPHTKILITTAYETLSSSARENGLMSGGNSMMINVTPLKYRSLYSIYPHRAHDEETIAQQIRQVVTMLKKFGRGPTDLGR